LFNLSSNWVLTIYHDQGGHIMGIDVYHTGSSTEGPNPKTGTKSNSADILAKQIEQSGGRENGELVYDVIKSWEKISSTGSKGVELGIKTNQDLSTIETLIRSLLDTNQELISVNKSDQTSLISVHISNK
jgi:hypothetical protein